MEVAIVSDYDRAGHVTFLLVFPFLIDCKTIGILHQVKEQAFSTVTTSENGIPENGRGQDVHSAEGLDRSFPKNFPFFGFHTSQICSRLHDDLFDST